MMRMSGSALASRAHGRKEMKSKVISTRVIFPVSLELCDGLNIAQELRTDVSNHQIPCETGKISAVLKRRSDEYDITGQYSYSYEYRTV